MSKILSALISLSLTACLAAGYFLNANYTADFSAYVILSLSIMTLFCAPFIGYYLQKFDDNDIEDSDVAKIIKPMTTRGFIMTSFSYVSLLIQVSLLTLTGSPAIAAFYLISSIITLTLRLSCKSRYKEWVRVRSD